jgi:hypothetical protein
MPLSTEIPAPVKAVRKRAERMREATERTASWALAKGSGLLIV